MAESSNSSVFATMTASVNTEHHVRNPRKTRRWSRTMGENLGRQDQEDGISELPDSILLHILSLLPSTREAVRTGSLSKRWQYLWTSVPTLIFHTRDFKGSKFDYRVDKTLAYCCQIRLKKLEVICDYPYVYQPQITQLIDYAVCRNVEELSISVYDFNLPVQLFSNGCLTNLSLGRCSFRKLRVIDWRNLKSLYIRDSCVSLDWINSILLGTPELEILGLCLCRGFYRLNITSFSVKKLVLQGYDKNWEEPKNGLDSLEIFAPYVLSLNISSRLYLKKVVLQDVSSLVEANLDYTVEPTYCTDEEIEEEMLKGFIKSLEHVKELKVGKDCYEVLSRLKAKGLAFLPNMKFPLDTSFHASLEGGGSGELNINGKKPVPETCGPCPETFGLWRGHKVLKSHVELLKAVEQQYPQTFGGLKIRAERVWEVYLEEFGNVITSFLQTLVSDLTEDRVGDIWENLRELGLYGFDVAWAFERLQKVEELQFGKPFQQELGKLNRTYSRWMKILQGLSFS